MVHKLFEQIAKKHPSNVAIEEQERTVDYQNLDASADILAKILIQVGVNEDKIVGVIIPSGISLITSLLAIFKAGGIYMPLDINFSSARLKQALLETFHGFLITSRLLHSKVLSIMLDAGVHSYYLITLDSDSIPIVERIENDRSIKVDIKPSHLDKTVTALPPDTGSYIFYTSGSTGEGKAILGSHASLTHFIQWEIEEFRINQFDRVSQLIQFTFDASLRDIFVPLCTGGTLVIPSEKVKSNPNQLNTWIQQQRITLIHTIPSIFRLLTREVVNTNGFPSLRYILLSGEPLYGKDIIEWRKRVGERTQLVNLYGLTETTLIKTFHRIDFKFYTDPFSPVHVGKPMSNVEILIVDEDSLCTQGKKGEILIRTKYLSKGYYNKPTLTKTVFKQNPFSENPDDLVFVTGDLGYYLEDGSVMLLGRKDDQIKINGIRVEPSEIEQALLKKEGVRSVVVTGKKNNEDGMDLVAYFVSDEVTPAEARRHLSVELNRNLIPSHFVKLAAFPLNSNGKVDKLALPDHRAITSERDLDEDNLLTSTEKEIEKLWLDVLKIQAIPKHSSFFDMGGGSLKAIQLIARIFKKFNILISIADVYDHPTITALGLLISKKHEVAGDAIVRISNQEYYELSMSQKRIWFINQIHTDPLLSSMPEPYSVHGDLDLAVLQKSFEVVISRHESLRTSFCVVKNIPYQKVRSEGESNFSIDFSDLSEKQDSFAEAILAARKAARIPFMLERDLLIRCHVFKFDKDKYIFLLNTHHIIADAWSIEILFRELFEIYDRLLTNTHAEFSSPLEIQYKDYAAWQHKKLIEGGFEDCKRYWIDSLSGTIQKSEFPVDELSRISDSNEGIFGFHLEAKTKEQLAIIARENDVSLFILLYCALNILINKYTGCSDIIVGAPVTGRDRAELENQIGYYVNMLPLRIKVLEEDTFKSLLKRARGIVLKAYEYQAFPVEEIIEGMKSVDGERIPLSILIQWRVNAEQRLKTNFDINAIDINYSGSVNHKFSFNFFDEEDSIRCLVGFDSNSYSRNSAEAIITNYNEIIRQLISDVSQPLSAIRLIRTQAESIEENNFLKSMSRA